MSYRITVFLPNWIGDAVMATPALRAIRDRFADAEITAVHRPVIGGVLDGLDLVDRRVVHDVRGQGSGLRGWRLIRELRAKPADVAILFPNSLRSAWTAWVSGAKRRVGMDRDGRRWLLTDPVTPRPRTIPNPVIDEYRRLAIAVGADAPSRKLELAVTPADRQQLADFWRNHPRLRFSRLVCLNPGGAFGAAKHWPAESFGLLAARLASSEPDVAVLVLCGPSEREQAAEICRVADHPRVVGLQGADLSIGLSKAAVESADLLLTTDSGPRHFAAAFDVPVVTLFGPTHIAWSETYFDKAVHLQESVDCGPCQQRVCPLGHHKCMTQLSVDRVYQAVASRLAGDAPNQEWVA